MEPSPEPAAERTYFPLPEGLTEARPIPVLGELPVRPRYRPPMPRRKVLLPSLLFVLTCMSTFFVGSHAYMRHGTLPNLPPEWSAILVIGFWEEGWKYMLAVMAVLLAHEMGHFVQAVRYGVPASLPFFIPMPFTPLGTMGAVIGMQGSDADRKELFDIGLTGPIAGLIVALPLTWHGIQIARAFPLNALADVHFQDPLLLKAMMWYLRPELKAGQELTMNPFLMAGWVGMLITGLNMLPISQLDGGHVAYAILGRRAYTLAWGVLLAAFAYMFWAQVYGWMVMVLLVAMIGVEHPPTANDRVPLGWARIIIGALSLAIPILCLAPNPMSVPGN